MPLFDLRSTSLEDQSVMSGGERPCCKLSLPMATKRKQAWWGHETQISHLQVEGLTLVRTSLPGPERTVNELLKQKGRSFL
jgi:hypothetical protein